MIHASTQAHQARRRKTSRRHRAMGDHPAPAAAAAGGGPAAARPPSSGGSLDNIGSSSVSAGSTAAALQLADMAAPRAS